MVWTYSVSDFDLLTSHCQSPILINTLSHLLQSISIYMWYIYPLGGVLVLLSSSSHIAAHPTTYQHIPSPTPTATATPNSIPRRATRPRGRRGKRGNSNRGIQKVVDVVDFAQPTTKQPTTTVRLGISIRFHGSDRTIRPTEPTDCSRGMSQQYDTL